MSRIALFICYVIVSNIANVMLIFHYVYDF